jgi:hypothetical protein
MNSMPTIPELLELLLLADSDSPAYRATFAAGARHLAPEDQAYLADTLQQLRGRIFQAGLRAQFPAADADELYYQECVIRFGVDTAQRLVQARRATRPRPTAGAA